MYEHLIYACLGFRKHNFGAVTINSNGSIKIDIIDDGGSLMWSKTYAKNDRTKNMVKSSRHEAV